MRRYTCQAVMLLADLRPAQGGQKPPAQRRCKEAHSTLIFCESRLSRYHGESRTPPPKTARLSQRCSCNATTQRSSTFIVGLGLVGPSLVSSSTLFVWFKLQVSLDSDLWNAASFLWLVEQHKMLSAEYQTWGFPFTCLELCRDRKGWR